MSNELQATPGASVPGFSGTVVETSLQPNAQHAPSAPSHISDTAGMSETQAAAMRWVDANRAALARDLNNVHLVRQNKAALAHVFHGGPAPDFLPQPEAVKTETAKQGARVVSEGDIPELAKGLEPVTDIEAEQLVTRGVVVGSLPREIASEVVDFGRVAQLPKGTVSAILDRLGAHADKGGGLGELTAEDVPALAERCAQLLGGYEKAECEIGLARKYLHTVGGDELLAKVDSRAGSLGFDPALILQLSYLARTKGLDK